MIVQSKTMKDSIGEGGNNTEKENEIAQLNQLGQQRVTSEGSSIE